MIQQHIYQQLQEVAGRFRAVWRARLLGMWWLCCAVTAAIWTWQLSHGWSKSTGFMLIGSCAVLGAVAGIAFAYRGFRSPRWVARRIESRYPQLGSRLLAAMEQQPELPGGQFGFLQQRVIQEAVRHGRHYDWTAAVSTRSMFLAHAFAIASLLVLGTAFTALYRGRADITERDAGDQLDAQIAASGPLEAVVEPGDVEIEKGTSLVITALFSGSIPDTCRLVYRTTEGADDQELSMTKSLGDPLFGCRLAEVQHDMTYHVAYEQQQSPHFQVRVFEFPRLMRADARLQFPDYTSLDARIVEDFRHLSAVEGTEVTITCFLNKQVVQAELRGAGFEPILLSHAPLQGDVHRYEATVTLNSTIRAKLYLRDQQGRENKDPPELVLNAIPNLPPQLTIMEPARDLEVSPLEEVHLASRSWDDFGMQRVGLSYRVGTGDEQEVVLSESLPGSTNHERTYLLDLEALSAEVDQLITYYFWAEDIGGERQLRRVRGDMYFAEVRPFEEIFRQGQQPPGGQQQQQQQQQGSQAAQDAQQLAELQKQIISGTWNLLRRGTLSETESVSADARVLAESQATAIEQLSDLAQRLQSPEAADSVKRIELDMHKSILQLDEAAEQDVPDPLDQALLFQQSAYQGLLKLRAREHEVTRGQPSQSQSQSANSRSQQQLQQLELDEEQNRYETQSEAGQPEDPAEREVRQALSRLRELAERQQDLNQRLKELQAELEATEDPEQRDELERQLKRLREQQQEILRDVDELRDRLQQPENQQRMQEQREQLDETREQVRRASEALEENQLSQALTSGTRAERELSEMRDELRNQASSRFAESMREMSDQARRLRENQQQLADRLQELAEPDPQGERTLRGPNRQEQIQEQFGQQTEQLNQLLEDIKQTIQEAEQPEPLLSQRLYDTFREARQNRVDEALDAAEELFRRGLLPQTQDAEQVARQGIEQLEQGVQQAAEELIGDESEALRRALDQLRRLNRDLQGEIQRADPREDSPGSDQQPSSQQQDGEPNSSENQDGQPTDQNSQNSDSRQPSDNQQDGQQPNSQSPGQPSDNNAPTNNQGQQQGTPSPGNPGGDPQSSQQPDADQQASQNQSPSSNQQPGQQPDGQQPGGQQPGQAAQGQNQPRSLRDDPTANNTSPNTQRRQGGDDRPLAPLTGADFREWSDRLRDVEEMVGDPELRGEAARIRDRARGVRIDLQRHSKEPNWDLVRENIAKPLVELQQRVLEELVRRQSDDALVPIDRDPVPSRFEDPVRRYYEQLGTGQ